MPDYHFMLQDSLRKVFPNRKPEELCAEHKQFYAMKGERVSFQLAYTIEYDGGEPGLQEAVLSIISDLQDRILVREAAVVPARLPGCREQEDEDYLFTQACLCPDVLLPVHGMAIRPLPYHWKSLWLTVDIGEELGAGSYAVTLRAMRDGKALWEDAVCIHVLEESLPQQELIHTEWFHADCLADYYRVPVFSQEHWRIMENFVGTAARHGMNMLLTPVFTPPLDTAEGGERTTVQLVGVTRHGTEYEFDFSLLVRWIGMCRRQGIRYLEISHLFTQWGAAHAPKIMVRENGVTEQAFGWDTWADGAQYRDFLRQFIPALRKLLEEEGVLGQTYFHISDEPSYEGKESYAAARDSVMGLLEGCKVIDALSSYELYKEGIVSEPVVSTDHIQAFLDAGVHNLWAYYCCAQGYKVSNRFMAIPPVRNRILGVQLYLYGIKGFLHWGYNFYNAQFSRYPVNPYLITDGDGGFPSGDAFVVYPAEDGSAYDSIRLEVFTEALYDLRALCRLEGLAGRRCVEALIMEGLSGPLTFAEYPRDAGYIRDLRRKIYWKIKDLQRRQDIMAGSHNLGEGRV